MKRSTLKETRARGYKTLIALAVIAVAVYFGFTPLFNHVPPGVAQAVIASSFGAIFVIILTMYLLNKQTEIEQESKRGERVFDEKVKLYQGLVKTTQEIVEDGHISTTEITKLPFDMINLQMVGADDTIQAFSDVYEKINDIYESSEEDDVPIHDAQKMEIYTTLSHFVLLCRDDLGISDGEENTQIFKRTIETVQRSSEAVSTKKGNKVFLDGIETWKESKRAEGFAEVSITVTEKLHNLVNEISQKLNKPLETRYTGMMNFVTSSKKKAIVVTWNTKGGKVHIVIRIPSHLGKEIFGAERVFDTNKEDEVKLIIDGEDDYTSLESRLKEAITLAF